MSEGDDGHGAGDWRSGSKQRVDLRVEVEVEVDVDVLEMRDDVAEVEDDVLEGGDDVVEDTVDEEAAEEAGASGIVVGKPNT